MRIKMIMISSMLILLFSCTNSPFNVNMAYSNIENYRFNTGDTEIEFVKDTEEYIAFIGHSASDPSSNFSVVENDYDFSGDIRRYLDVQGSSYTYENIILDKIEVHYVQIRRIDFSSYQPPTNLGVYLKRFVTTHEPIVEDSLDMVLRDKQYGMMEVNASYLHLGGYGVTKIRMKGTAQHFVANFSVSRENNLGPEINFAELQADSCFLILNNYPSLAHPYTRIDVHANDYLEIEVSSLVDGCPSCTCEVYYKGHPTIVNQSPDPRIVIIDDN